MRLVQKEGKPRTQVVHVDIVTGTDYVAWSYFNETNHCMRVARMLVRDRHLSVTVTEILSVTVTEILSVSVTEILSVSVTEILSQ